MDKKMEKELVYAEPTARDADVPWKWRCSTSWCQSLKMHHANLAKQEGCLHVQLVQRKYWRVTSLFQKLLKDDSTRTLDILSLASESSSHTFPAVHNNGKTRNRLQAWGREVVIFFKTYNTSIQWMIMDALFQTHVHDETVINTLWIIRAPLQTLYIA